MVAKVAVDKCSPSERGGSYDEEEIRNGKCTRKIHWYRNRQRASELSIDKLLKCINIGFIITRDYATAAWMDG